jgi:type IV pilus assembly protein PilV
MKRALDCRGVSIGTSAGGFSLVEVLVALVIIGVGMLGLAKIEILAYASTSTASQRSIAALEAASLAAAMHSNRNYWSATPATLVTITGTTITPSDAALSGTTSCKVVGTPCSASAVAAYDLHQWVTDLNAALPNPTGTVSCPTPVSGPVNCTIQVSWTENQTGINSQSQGNSMAASVYTLYVVP